MNLLVPPSSRFFFNSGHKKMLSPTGCKVWSTNPFNKWRLQLLHQSQENYPTKFHNNPVNVPCWGIPPYIMLRLLFFFLLGMIPPWYWGCFLLSSRGFVWVWIMGSQNVTDSGYGGNISVSLWYSSPAMYSWPAAASTAVMSSTYQQWPCDVCGAIPVFQNLASLEDFHLVCGAWWCDRTCVRVAYPAHWSGCVHFQKANQDQRRTSSQLGCIASEVKRGYITLKRQV